MESTSAVRRIAFESLSVYDLSTISALEECVAPNAPGTPVQSLYIPTAVHPISDLASATPNCELDRTSFTQRSDSVQ